MYADNFYIALYDAERQMINFPYYVDEVTDQPDPNVWEPFGSGYAARHHRLRPAHRSPDAAVSRRLEAADRTRRDRARRRGGGDWLGVPLKSEGQTLGASSSRATARISSTPRRTRSCSTFVGQHIASALERTRLIDETRQRNAELALINSVQRGLADELDLQAIYDLVGDEIRDIFDAQVVDIAISTSRPACSTSRT